MLTFCVDIAPAADGTTLWVFYAFIRCCSRHADTLDSNALLCISVWWSIFIIHTCCWRLIFTWCFLVSSRLIRSNSCAFLLSFIFICSFSPLYDVEAPLYPCIPCLVSRLFLMFKPRNPGCSGIAIFPDVCIDVYILCIHVFVCV